MLKCLECGQGFEPGLRNQATVIGEVVEVSYQCDNCKTWNIIQYSNPYIYDSYPDKEI